MRATYPVHQITFNMLTLTLSSHACRLWSSALAIFSILLLPLIAPNTFLSPLFSYRLCHTACMNVPTAVRTVDNSWWWAQKMTETCWVLWHNKCWLFHASSRSFYTKLITMHRHLNIKLLNLYTGEKITYFNNSSSSSNNKPAVDPCKWTVWLKPFLMWRQLHASRM